MEKSEFFGSESIFYSIRKNTGLRINEKKS